MADCVIGLGSNLGDRAATLRRALSQMACIGRSRVVGRSLWHETSPVGGPARQGPYLNGAVRLATALTPEELFAELRRIEADLGRVRAERWGPRLIDLDLLLYGSEQCGNESGPGAPCRDDALVLPHPRMHLRRFVLQPAVEVAPWLLHPPSEWTLARLLRHLEAGDDFLGVVAADAALAEALVAGLNARRGGGRAGPHARPWSAQQGSAPRWNPGPRAVIAVRPAAGTEAPAWRKMLGLPPTGPITWLSLGPLEAMLDEAWTVVATVWPSPAA